MAEYLTNTRMEHPFVLMLGHGHDCSQAFSIINGQALTHSTLLDAVDMCFKAYYVFDLKYPNACTQVYEFLQTVYEIPGAVRPTVQVLRAQFSAAV